MHVVTVFQIVMVCFGIVGNVLSMAVWSRKSMRSSTGIYFFGHSFVNIGFLSSFFITHGIADLLPNVALASPYGAFFAYAGFPMCHIFAVCSIWFTVGVNVDRYMQVCWINKAKKWCSLTKSLAHIGKIAAFGVVVNVPHFLMYEISPVEERNATDVAYRLTSFGESGLAEAYDLWLHCLALVVIPWILIFTLNILIILRVKDVGKKVFHNAMLHVREKTRRFENQLTGTLIFVSFTFLILTLLQCASQCVYMMDKRKHVVYAELFSFAQLGLVLYTSVNFFLYCLSSKRFRVELQDLLCLRCCCKNSSIVETFDDVPTEPEIDSAPASTAPEVGADADQSSSESGVFP
ncbi:probable G-protein coupled receptor 139 [Dreissena polymorpha]|uniref:probable G-protein coupled receptor 139 n=1 Tax=Dreissena polymorpha TaxID=45954 RepID=UPI002264AD1E|nr:probable G-protein coupled receptor 139 [Dreissena polymorpha]